MLSSENKSPFLKYPIAGVAKRSPHVKEQRETMANPIRWIQVNLSPFFNQAALKVWLSRQLFRIGS